MMKEGPHLKREGKKETAASTRQPLEKHQKGKIGFSHGQAPRYVAFDIETTGLYPQKGDRIIEIGAVVLDHGSVVQEFHSLINPGTPIHRAVQKVHGITNEMLASEPSPEDVMPLFHQFMGQAYLVAHNAPFDMGFLRQELGRLDLSLVNKCYCTFKIAKKLVPGLPDYRLETVYRHLFGDGFHGLKRHRALEDARMTAKVWVELRRRAAPLVAHLDHGFSMKPS